MSAEESKAIVRRFWGVWEEGNIDLVDELLAPDYTNHTPASPDQPTGPEGVKGIVTMFRSAMPDLKVIVEDMIAEEVTKLRFVTRSKAPMRASSSVSRPRASG